MPDHTSIPRARQIVRHAAPRVTQATIVPTLVFLVGHAVLGLAGALAAALAWSWGCIAWRHATGRAVGGLLPIGAVGLSLRTVLALVSGSTYVYFAGPALITAAVGLGFVASAASKRPVVSRVVADFVPLPASTLQDVGIDRLMRRLSVLWGFEQVVSAAINLWLYRHLPLSRYLVLRGPVGWLLALAALAASLAAGRRRLRSSAPVIPVIGPLAEANPAWELAPAA
ncbi:MAG: hypothetical protein QOG64_1959 [Acidimicrobiaceae bacterium]|nr:hypothetical protein [Acidimicrobiaceae bacterium]